eukprot:s823_g12.t1
MYETSTEFFNTLDEGINNQRQLTSHFWMGLARVGGWIPNTARPFNLEEQRNLTHLNNENMDDHYQEHGAGSIRSRSNRHSTPPRRSPMDEGDGLTPNMESPAQYGAPETENEPEPHGVPEENLPAGHQPDEEMGPLQAKQFHLWYALMNDIWMDSQQAILFAANEFRDACAEGRWADARCAAVSLKFSAARASEDSDGIMDLGKQEGTNSAKRSDVLWFAASSARSGLLKMLAAFSARVARGPSQELALAAVAACTAMLPEVWPAGAADDLLSMSGVLILLLRAAATVSRTMPGMGGFATLRACRAAAELLTELLEASAPDLRLSCEAALLRDSTLAAPMQCLSEALLSVHPDPRLNEAFLELLWRGLRRVAPGAALSSLASAHPALICLEECQAGLCSKLRSLSPDQLLADARGLALELCASPPVAFTFMSKGWYDGQMGTTVFSSHCIGLHQEGELEPYLELPWECCQLRDLRLTQAYEGLGFENFQVVAVLLMDHVQLLQLGCMSEGEAQPSSALELLLDGSLEESPKASTPLGFKTRAKIREQKSREPVGPIVAPLVEEVDEFPDKLPIAKKPDGRPQRAVAVKTAAKPGSKRNTDAKRTEPCGLSRPPQDAVQRVLEEASRLAREVANVQKQFRESKAAVDARGDEATALLDDIAKAGIKRNRVD